MHVQVRLLQLKFFPTIALPREIKPTWQVQAYGLKTWNLGQRFRCVCVWLFSSLRVFYAKPLSQNRNMTHVSALW